MQKVSDRYLLNFLSDNSFQFEIVQEMMHKLDKDVRSQ